MSRIEAKQSEAGAQTVLLLLLVAANIGLVFVLWRDGVLGGRLARSVREGLKAAHAGAQPDASGLRARLSALERVADSLTADMAALQVRLPGMQGRSGAAETSPVDGVKSEVDAARRATDSLLARVEALEAAASAQQAGRVPADPPTQPDRGEQDLQQQVADLQERAGQWPDMIEQRVAQLDARLAHDLQEGLAGLRGQLAALLSEVGPGGVGPVPPALAQDVEASSVAAPPTAESTPPGDGALPPSSTVAQAPADRLGGIGGSWDERLLSYVQLLTDCTGSGMPAGAAGAVEQAAGYAKYLVGFWQDLRPPDEDRKPWGEWNLRSLDYHLYGAPQFGSTDGLPGWMQDTFAALAAAIGEGQEARRAQLCEWGVERIVGVPGRSEVEAGLLERDPAEAFQPTSDPRLDRKLCRVLPGKGGYRIHGEVVLPALGVFYACGA